ncbi:MAG: ATP-binding protein [Thermodesulfobacteriota bacterium]
MTRGRDHRQVFPFTAIVGQDHLKRALIINAIVPGGVGVLIRGEKGTAKSTCARALACLLSDISSGPFPFVTLPVNASEDNLVGGLDFEYALAAGQKRFNPGILARAHGGILYVDEVNLLDDHLADLITDTVAAGTNRVEREGVSLLHAARFSMVATMNPEEGELRPQLLDRFGLCVNVAGIRDLSLRVELLRRREAFDRDPAAFEAVWEEEQRREARRLAEAMRLYDSVTVSNQQIDFVVAACIRAGAAGHRAEIVAVKAARALTAYAGRPAVTDRDIKAALLMALVHRARSSDNGTDHLVTEPRPESIGHADAPGHAARPRHLAPDKGADTSASPCPAATGGEGSAKEHFPPPASSGQGVMFGIDESITVSTREIRHTAARQRQKAGRRHRSVADDKRGRYIRFTSCRTGHDIALDATIRAAAVHQKNRPRGPLAVTIAPEDIREKIREHKTRTLLIFVVDASGSMGTRLMKETKGAVLSLLLEAYQKRDRVAMIAFRDRKGEILLPPTDSVDLARRKLRDLPAGGKTPLAAGLMQGYRLARSGDRRKGGTLPLLILVSDGRANVGANPGVSYSMERAGRIYDEIFSLARIIKNDLRIKTMVINTEHETRGGFGMAERIAEELGGRYVSPARIRADSITRAVRAFI